MGDHPPEYDGQICRPLLYRLDDAIVEGVRDGLAERSESQSHPVAPCVDFSSLLTSQRAE